MNIKATVVQGVQIGAKFGIATANLELTKLPEIEEGVYLVEVVVKDETYNGLLHFGQRKTFGGDVSAEVHILDFETDIYGETLSLEILKRLRGVQAFKNADALFTQIETDVLVARKYFLRRKVWATWKQVSLTDQQKLAEMAVRHLSNNMTFLEAKTVFCYAPQFGKEIAFVSALMEAFPNKKFVFPRIEEGTMHFYAVTSYGDLKPGFKDILEPVKSDAVMPDEYSVMLVPSVAVSKEGFRLGQGGGFYDRYLANNKVKTLAVMPNFAVLDGVPTEKHDKAVDGVIMCEF